MGDDEEIKKTIYRIQVRERVRKHYYRHLEQERAKKREIKRKWLATPEGRAMKQIYTQRSMLRKKRKIVKVNTDLAATGKWTSQIVSELVGVTLGDFTRLELGGIIPPNRGLDGKKKLYYDVNQVGFMVIAFSTHTIQLSYKTKDIRCQFDLMKIKDFLYRWWGRTMRDYLLRRSGYGSDTDEE